MLHNHNELLEQFHADGYLVLPGIIPADETTALRAELEAAFDEPSAEAAMYHLPNMWRPKMFERGGASESLLDNPYLIDLIEAIVGPKCHVIANNALKTGPGEGISGWHVDEEVRVPIPDGVELDPRMPMPCYIVNTLFYLCDVDIDLGPTEFVPGSHRAGRDPRPSDNDASGNPTYKGRSAVSGTGPAGTCVMWNDQTWHRGATNRTADRYRWVQGVAYGRRWVSQRFYPFVSYNLPEGVVERANPRRRRLLGMHDLGAYG